MKRPIPRPYCPDPDYSDPTPLAIAIQMPLNDPHWQSRVLSGYVRTVRKDQTSGEAKP